MVNLLDKKQCAEKLNVCVRTVERLMYEKKLPYVRITSGTVRFRGVDVDAFIESQIVNRKALERLHLK
jgi:excisionase family DNA binding protein